MTYFIRDSSNRHPPDQARDLFHAGLRFLHQRRPGEAARRLEAARTLAPRDAEIALNLGGAYIMQHRFDEAVGVLEEATRLDPGNAMAWLNLAAAYLGPLAKSTPAAQERAIQAYQAALQADPQVPNVHYMLGLIYRQRGEWLRAAAHFSRALEINPADLDARAMLDAVNRTDGEDRLV
ncbi:MAG: tetratricopeptide repeat protein [Ardenticatenaceae bacterium]|nr:tetratricopeptide repeat protein [Ardenticatenaceae bacterium]HBY99380.1 hypothetical protein [Chloroflexota bacterium]